jgi:antitoxin (DNA-binding transcriptional repressor) of toxin-antitoxin stability system
MATVSVAEAKQKLTSLISAAEAGETVTITRHGKPVAEIRAAGASPARAPSSIDWVRQQLGHIPADGMDGATSIRQMRDEE